jgi:hypothetical protein
MLDQPESPEETRISPGCPGSASGSLPGVDWVEVNDEPNHAERFRNDAVRVYEARIEPGTATLYHHHSLDTIYVIMAGGRFRSDEPMHQKSSTKLGRSVSSCMQQAILQCSRPAPASVSSTQMNAHAHTASSGERASGPTSCNWRMAPCSRSSPAQAF